MNRIKRIATAATLIVAALTWSLMVAAGADAGNDDDTPAGTLICTTAAPYNQIIPYNQITPLICVPVAPTPPASVPAVPVISFTG